MEEITITKVEYDQLIRDQYFLHCLVTNGVDNWYGYDDSYDMYAEVYPDEE